MDQELSKRGVRWGVYDWDELDELKYHLRAIDKLIRRPDTPNIPELTAKRDELLKEMALMIDGQEYSGTIAEYSGKGYGSLIRSAGTEYFFFHRARCGFGSATLPIVGERATWRLIIKDAKIEAADVKLIDRLATEAA